jgi:hypothetical protein
MTGGFMGRSKEELRRQELEQKLTAYGEAGWELTLVLMEQQLHGEKDGHVFIFKTPAQPKT